MEALVLSEMRKSVLGMAVGSMWVEETKREDVGEKFVMQNKLKTIRNEK